MTPEPVGQPAEVARTGPTVLRAAPPRRPGRRRVVIAGAVLLAAAVMTSGLLLSDSHPLLGMLLAVAVGMNVATIAYGLWAGGAGRVTVEEHDVVLRPGRVLDHRFRIQDVAALSPATTRWRGASLRLRDGRAAGLPSLSEQDVQRLGELLQEADARRSAPGAPGAPGAPSANGGGGGAREGGALVVSAGAGRGGAVRAPGAARWPDLPRQPDALDQPGQPGRPGRA